MAFKKRNLFKPGEILHVSGFAKQAARSCK